MPEQSSPPLPAAPLSSAFHQRRAILIVMGAAAIHAWAVWGYTGLFWGEHGRWLHIVSRFAGGEVPYRDFTYTNPPLALWIVGGIARFTGPSFEAISATMVALFLLIVGVYLLSLKRLVPHLVLPIALPALLFALSFASRYGAPLSAGTDSPAAPIGFLFVIGAAWLLLETVERPTVPRAAAVGLMIALVVLSKHDFWPSAGYLLVAGGVFLARRRASLPVQAAAPGVFAGIMLSGLAIMIGRAGWRPVRHMIGGSGRALEIMLLSSPSVERLTVEVAAAAALALTAVAALWLCLAISDRAASRWAGALITTFLSAAAIHLGMSIAIGRALRQVGPARLPTPTEDALWHGLSSGRSLSGAALGLFDTRFQAHLFPLILPPILLVVVLARWKQWHDPTVRSRLALLLGLCVVSRLRRGFAGADWYNVILELPAYALFLELLCGPAREKAARTVRAALSMLLVLGLYAYVSLSVGPFTLQGALPATRTRNGTVHWPGGVVRAYQIADSLLAAADASGQRPVYALGYSGGWNFFLKRPNPLPYPAGLPSSDSATQAFATQRLHAARPAPLLIENRDALLPSFALSSVFDWELSPAPSVFAKVDWPWFASVARTCSQLGSPDSTVIVVVFDCRW